ncbi:MAG: AAA family ATPase [Acidaminococcus sp.]|jgi:wobble nucleotide-excising tRNase|nr:AAA family ATPase [Acidaminococcus sp.]
MNRKYPSEITEIRVDDATFKNTGTVITPTYINYFFGNNGTGKSTIAKAIQSGTGIKYAPGRSATDYQVLVFNQEYINRNMQNFHNLPGVFTMAEENAEIQDKIDEAAEQLADAQEKVSDATDEKEKLIKIKKEICTKFYDEIWRRTGKLRKTFPGTQAGYLKSKANLADKVKLCSPSEYDLDDLKRMYDSAYSSTAQSYPRFNTISDTTVLDSIEGSEILSVAIVNSSDTQLAKFWKKIEASEWVRQGHSAYHGKTDGKCPFCSQPLPSEFEKFLTDSFDDQYEKNLTKLSAFLEDYRNTANALFMPLSKLPEPLYPVLDEKPYKDKLEALRGIISTNINRIKEKIAEPSKSIKLDNTAPLLQELQKMITDYNKLISDNNMVVADAPKKKEECKEKVFSFMSFITNETIKAFNKSISDINKQLNKQQEIIDTQTEQGADIREEIRVLNSQTKETESAMNNINLMLKDAGFQGFKVCPHWEERRNPDGSVKRVIPSPIRNYAVVRTDTETGEEEIAHDLSEGEKNFIAFLYFQQTVFGSTDADSDSLQKIVVIDDPVSSMDSGTLFIVSAQIRKMIHICRNNVDNRQPAADGNFIKQIFILTHNAYFHREVSYLYARQWNFVSFYLVRKINNKSSVQLFEKQNPDCPTKMMNVNPVKNSYAALWESYKEVRSGIPLKSTIRRILEYYFLQLCGYEGDDLRKRILEDHKNNFLYDENGHETPERYEMAKVLLSYIISDNSSVNDGINYTDDFLDEQLYRDTFKMIFKYINQEQHFNMMMGNEQGE